MTEATLILARELNTIARDGSLTAVQALKKAKKLDASVTAADLALVAGESHQFVPTKDGEHVALQQLEDTPPTRASRALPQGRISEVLSTLPDFTKGSIMTSMAMSLNYRMMGQALKLIQRDKRESTSLNRPDADPNRVPTIDDEGADETITRVIQYKRREEESNTSPMDEIQSPEQLLFELQNVRAAFADAAFDLNSNARIGFNQMLEDAKTPRVNASDVALFMELEQDLPKEVVEKMFLQYAEQRCAEIAEHEAALVETLRCYDTVGCDLDDELAKLRQPLFEDVMNKLVAVIERRQAIVDPMANNEPAWVKRMNPLARYKESKLLKGAANDLDKLLSAQKPKRRAI